MNDEAQYSKSSDKYLNVSINYEKPIEINCTFCGKNQHYVNKLVAGYDQKYKHEIYICNECIEVCGEIMQ